MNRLDDGRIAIRGGRIVLIPREAPLYDALIIMRRERGKPVLSFRNIPNIKHGQPLSVIEYARGVKSL